ncbi:hypothetical protein KSS87_012566 [Heliosperma pusillum]|nr:hypothetical protein KSS87_012566 [Heliosperma pusillum]
MQSTSEANQRIARIAAHLSPPNYQVMEGGSNIGRANCRAKGAAPGFKVAILGAAGGIGQPLSMLMKMNPLVSVLHLYDVVNTLGVTADISHMDTGAVVRGFVGKDKLDEALMGMELIIIPAGVPRKPGMTRDDLFNINAGIVRTLCEGIVRCCPRAVVNLISNPVNSTVPIAAQVFKKAGIYDPKRLLGVTMLDVVRANTFVAEALNLDPREVDVPVAKAGAGSATLSMAYAAVKFADACLRGLRGDAGVIECTFVDSQVTELPFFATKVRLGRSGAEEIFPLGPLNEYERVGLEKAKKELAVSIEKGVAFMSK